MYGDLDTYSKDILNLKIGNVPPNELVSIEIAYLQELTLSCNTFYELLMMGTISPRYMNHIPQEKIISGFNKKVSQRRGEFYWYFNIHLKASRTIIFSKSQSHPLKILSSNN